MNNLELLSQGEVEHAAWQELCRQLQATGAVTEEDGAASVRANDTPGQKLFHAIRTWGNELGRFRVMQADAISKNRQPA